MADKGTVDKTAVEEIEVTEEMEGELSAMGKGEEAEDEELG